MRMVLIMYCLGLLWQCVKFVFSILLLLFFIYGFWHGWTLESGNIKIELYGIGRFFK